MARLFYCLTALPKDSDSETRVGCVYAQRKNAMRLAKKLRDNFRRVTVWYGSPGGVRVADLYPVVE